MLFNTAANYFQPDNYLNQRSFTEMFPKQIKGGCDWKNFYSKKCRNFFEQNAKVLPENSLSLPRNHQKNRNEFTQL